MGDCFYANSLGVGQDFKKAKELYSKTCAKGIMNGCYNLGLLYHQGLGGRQDYKKAKELYAKVCDEGDQDGCNMYKKLNEEGP